MATLGHLSIMGEERVKTSGLLRLFLFSRSQGWLRGSTAVRPVYPWFDPAFNSRSIRRSLGDANLTIRPNGRLARRLAQPSTCTFDPVQMRESTAQTFALSTWTKFHD